VHDDSGRTDNPRLPSTWESSCLLGSFKMETTRISRPDKKLNSLWSFGFREELAPEIPMEECPQGISTTGFMTL
jgi:hypothetical protein